MDEDFSGCVFIFLGAGLLYYVFNKRRRSKEINDWRAIIGGSGLVLFGLYLIIMG